MAKINWDEIEKKLKENRDRLEALQEKMKENSLDINNQVYDLEDVSFEHPMCKCNFEGNDSNEPEIFVDPDFDYKQRFDSKLASCSFNNPLKQPFQKSLSFNDMDQNELWLIGLSMPDGFIPEKDFITKANQLFVHTFLGDYK